MVQVGAREPDVRGAPPLPAPPVRELLRIDDDGFWPGVIVGLLVGMFAAFLAAIALVG